MLPQLDNLILEFEKHVRILLINRLSRYKIPLFPNNSGSLTLGLSDSWNRG